MPSASSFALPSGAREMPDVRDLTIAYVHKDGRLAATLTREGTGTTFQYLPEYLADDMVPIGTTLPLTDRPVATPGRSVPAFFAALLPEGRRLTALRTSLKVSADDELSMLLAVGADPVGDIAVTATPEPPTPEEPVAVSNGWGDLRFEDLVGGLGIGDPSTLAGVQDKVSGRMITVPLTRAASSYLLKLTPPEFPHLVANEAFFLRHAQALPMTTVHWEIVRDRDDVEGLLIHRFDRIPTPAGVLRLPAEDATQLLDRYPADKYNVSAEAVATAVAAACASAPLARRSIFVQVAWAWLTGNGDLHAKNVSVVGTAPTLGGSRAVEMVVAPVYDIPSTLPYRDFEMALPIDGRRDGITGRRLLAFAQAIGLPDRAAASALAATMLAAEAMVDDIRTGGSPWRGKQADDLMKQLEFRHAQLAID